jgi:hypothetical protein
MTLRITIEAIDEDREWEQRAEALSFESAYDHLAALDRLYNKEPDDYE